MGKRSISNTTSTGAGEFIFFNPPVEKITALVVVEGGSTGTGSFRIQAGIDTESLSDLIAASTFTATRTLSSTSANLITVARADITAYASTKPLSVIIAGR